MKDIHLNLELQTIPPVARRGEHVLVLPQNTDGKLLFGGKKFYPTGIVRLLGGGMDPGEDSLTAAQREMAEELHINLTPAQLEEIAKIILTISVANEPVPTLFTTYLYFAKLTPEQANFTANDDIDQVAALTTQELEQLIARYAQLSPVIEGGRDFSWADYGQIYGPIHQLALDFVRARR